MIARIRVAVVWGEILALAVASVLVAKLAAVLQASEGDDEKGSEP